MVAVNSGRDEVDIKSFLSKNSEFVYFPLTVAVGEGASKTMD